MQADPAALAHRIMPLKSRNIGKCQLAVMDVDTPEFGAAMQGGKHLARIEQTLGVERTLQPLLLGEIDVAEHFRHEVAFFDADAVFAGQHAAKLDAQPQDVRAEGFRLVHLIRDVCIKAISGCRLPSPA